MKERYQKRKKLEVGGFTPDEVENFTSQDLDYLLKKLIKKGRIAGTFRGQEEEGRHNAAKAWFDALAIYVKSPASLSLADKTLIFPIYSGLLVFLKGNLIVQDDKLEFERNLVDKFVRDTEGVDDPVHRCRALAAKCDIEARLGNNQTAVETFQKIKKIYDPQTHSELACSLYGTDRAAQMYARQTYWYFKLGDIEKSLECSDYVIENILPLMDEKNMGLSKEQAEHLVIDGFFESIIEKVQNKKQKEIIKKFVQDNK